MSSLEMLFLHFYKRVNYLFCTIFTKIHYSSVQARYVLVVVDVANRHVRILVPVSYLCNIAAMQESWVYAVTLGIGDRLHLYSVHYHWFTAKWPLFS